jgi:signal transduction histidine kinase
VVHLRRLLFNLADNAFKYTPPGGKVRISVGREGDRAVLIVADTGIGIPGEEQQKVFQRFYRSPEARSGVHGGSGLGLSIARSIAEAHRGRIELDSSPGKGSTFRVYLPLGNQDRQQA